MLALGINTVPYITGARGAGGTVKQFTLRDVPDEVASVLQHEAEERGQSMSAVLRMALADYAYRRRQREL